MGLPDEVVSVFLEWTSVTPDKRQWKPSMPVLSPISVHIEILVPKKFVTAHTPDLIALTPDGMRYVIDQLEEVMKEKESNDKNDEIEWNDEDETTSDDEFEESDDDNEEWS